MIIILAGEVIVATSETVETQPWGYETPEGRFPKAAGITGIATADLPPDFTTARYVWRAGALVRRPDPPPSQAEILAKLRDYAAAINAHINEVAGARGYDSGVSCVSYLTSSSPAWAAEAAVFVLWRDAVWIAAYAALATYQADGVAPDLGRLLAALPAIRWPA